MTAIADSSPLILYAKIDRLDLLQHVCEQIVIPPPVWQEVVVEGAKHPGAIAIAEAEWISVREIKSAPENIVITGLGPGETAAITLAVQSNGAHPLLLDDRKARAVARSHGLSIIGSVGILILAKESGVIDAVSPLLTQLRDAGLFLSTNTMRDLLALAGEQLNDTIT